MKSWIAAVAAAASILSLHGCGGGGDDTFKFQCPDDLDSVFADMHDRNLKRVVIKGSSMTITPQGGDETWAVHSVLDADSCAAMVDFDVPGKSDHPPVSLSATLGVAMDSQGARSYVVGYTDPSGTLADTASYPLNQWIDMSPLNRSTSSFSCPTSFTGTFVDMLFGDQMQVTIGESAMTILPYANNQTWHITAALDSKFCNASVDFNVSGKPNPTPVNLTATFQKSISVSGEVSAHLLTFNDPSGTVVKGHPETPLKQWVQTVSSSALFA